MSNLIPQCDETCPECKGNGHIGGDTYSPWCCTKWVARERKAREKNNEKS